MVLALALLVVKIYLKQSILFQTKILLCIKTLSKNIPQKEVLGISHMTNDFIRSLSTKKNTYDDIKNDMIAKGLKGKEYIHSIGK